MNTFSTSISALARTAAPRAVREIFDLWAARVGNKIHDAAESLRGRIRALAAEALSDFERYLQALCSEASSRVPGLREDSSVRFALNELGPRRIAAAIERLEAPEDLDYVDLVRHLDVLKEAASFDVAHAAVPEEVGDALIQALDGLHDYLLAHGLVTRQYLRDQDLLTPVGPRTHFKPRSHPRRTQILLGERAKAASEPSFSSLEPHRRAVSA